MSFLPTKINKIKIQTEREGPQGSESFSAGRNDTHKDDRNQLVKEPAVINKLFKTERKPKTLGHEKRSRKSKSCDPRIRVNRPLMRRSRSAIRW